MSGRAEYKKRWEQALRDKFFALYGWACACCREATRTFLTLDHIDGSGGAQRYRGPGLRPSNNRPAYRDAVAAYRPDKYRTLCFNCQHGYRLGVCPHVAEGQAEGTEPAQGKEARPQEAEGEGRAHGGSALTEERTTGDPVPERPNVLTHRRWWGESGLVGDRPECEDASGLLERPGDGNDPRDDTRLEG